MKRIFHVFNRGMAKQDIFRDEADYYRFVYCLYKLNNQGGAIRTRKDRFNLELPEQDRIVEILKWSLLPNHYHLLLCEAREGGVTDFIKRLGNAYTKYFNTRYEKSGYLFQNKAKVVEVENESQFMYIPFYIDFNPLDLKFPSWKKNDRIKEKEATKFLTEYRWSSFRDYAGEVNFPQVINIKMFNELFDTNEKKYLNDIREWFKIDSPRVNVAR